MILQPVGVPSVKFDASPRALVTGLWKGLTARAGHAVARFASYNAASPTATTTTGTRIGTNPQDPNASMQRVGMQWTGEDIAKNAPLCAAYLGVRQNYCSSMMKFIPATGDPSIDEQVRLYLHGHDGFGGVFANMGVDCSMQDAFMRTADLEMPVRGDSGMIWYDDGSQMRLMEFSADQLGEVYYFTPPRSTNLTRNSVGDIVECAGGGLTYFAGRYFRGCDCVAYKIYQRSSSWYSDPRIYQSSDVIYFRDPASFRGVRGVTFFASAIQHMEKGEQLFQIGMDAALRQAKTAMVVYNNRGQPDENTYANTVNLDGTVTYRERIPAGPLTEYFYTGDKAEFASPDSPGPELIEGVATSDERVALALRVNYAFLVNPSRVGGAPSRLEINKGAKEMARIQNQIHRPKLRQISYVAIMDGVRRGNLPAHPGITHGRWMLPISPTVDAFRDGKENVNMVRAGLEAPQDVIAETNRDAEDVISKNGQWAERVAIEVEDRNRSLVKLGYKPTITVADISQNSDNPAQSAVAEETIQNGLVPKDRLGEAA